MYRKEIKFKDFDGNETTEVHYFNLTKTELINLEVGSAVGLAASIQRIIETGDRGELIKEFQRIILLSYGQRSEDGRRFIKSEELREEFTQTLAYDALFTELSFDDKAAALFIKNVVPTEFAEEIDKQTAAILPPPPPPTA